MGNFGVEYNKLNAAQKIAVDKIDGPLLVIAGPGTGKTQLLSLRVANILQLTDTDPSNILCLTFTEAAARNMRDRLVRFIGPRASQVALHTFHSFGVDIINRYPEYFYDQPLVQPVGELSSYELLREIMIKLPHRNPLHLRIGDELFHLSSVHRVIGWLKQAGISPQEGQTIIKQNRTFIHYAEPHVQPVFHDSPHRSHISEYEKLAKSLVKYANQHKTNTLAVLCAEELQDALAALEPTSRYVKPITAWRNRWLTQDHNQHWIMTDRKRTDIFACITEVYEKFQDELSSQGLYTFDDMILRNIAAIRQSDELRLTLQEQYHYLMVDEYQDTNGAQNQFLELLADNPVNEGRPNLMVVGDDDQAIYRFQGAHISIMQDFLQRWRDTEEVVLTENYRFGKAILDTARSVIVQGEERLENRLPNINKQLTVAKSPAPLAKVYRPQTYSESDQYRYIAEEIRRLINKGQKASDIAVLAPKHSYLQALVPFLANASVPIAYERREHVLDQPHIRELIIFARAVLAANQMNWTLLDSLLPELLSAEYWGISARDIWQLSLEVNRKKLSWLETMQHHKELRHIASGLLALAKRAVYLPLEALLDELVGTTPLQLENNKTWTSPYRSYYFSEEKLSQHPETYLRLLGQLTTLRNAVREYSAEKQQTQLKDFVRFIEAYQQSPLPLLDTSPSGNTSEAVQLLTAYKAKGLEWPIVFVLGCHENIWGKKARSKNLTFGLPTNLTWVQPARNTVDDHLRLFFVALTRAREALYLTCFEQTDAGQPTEPLRWLTALDNADIAPVQLQTPATVIERIKEAELRFIKQSSELKTSDVRQSIQPELDRLKLSASHINNFLDITKGGPRQFFYRHILHFPESPQPSIVFGLAMHAALHSAHIGLMRNGKLPSLSNLREELTAYILSSAVDTADKQRLIARGNEAIGLYMKHRRHSFQSSDKSEYSFANEGVTVEGVPLSGKIDVIKRVGPSDYHIVDYKTGAALTDWQPKKNDYTQLRAYLYQKQLIFYRLLMTESTTYKRADITEARLQFIEPTEDNNFPTFVYDIKETDLSRMRQLIKIIWRHIMALDFPDTTKYPLTLKGLKQFEADLLAGEK